MGLFYEAKSDARAVIPKFFTMVEAQFNVVIKRFRFDNAPKLSFTDIFTSKRFFIEHYKARLVGKDYTQQEDLDFFDTFHSITKLETH